MGMKLSSDSVSGSVSFFYTSGRDPFESLSVSWIGDYDLLLNMGLFSFYRFRKLARVSYLELELFSMILFSFYGISISLGDLTLSLVSEPKLPVS